MRVLLDPDGRPIYMADLPKRVRQRGHFGGDPDSKLFLVPVPGPASHEVTDDGDGDGTDGDEVRHHDALKE